MPHFRRVHALFIPKSLACIQGHESYDWTALQTHKQSYCNHNSLVYIVNSGNDSWV